MSIHIIKKHDDGTETVVASTFSMDDAGKVVDDEGSSLLDDPTVVEIILRPINHERTPA